MQEKEIFKPVVIPEKDLIIFPADIREMLLNAMKQKYQVSNKGNVYSIKTDKIMKQNKNSNGYLRVELSFSNKNYNIDFCKKFFVHQLVAQTFCKTDDDQKIIVHHKDKNILNNNADNLIFVSIAEHQKIHNELREKEKEK